MNYPQQPQYPQYPQAPVQPPVQYPQQQQQWPQMPPVQPAPPPVPLAEGSIDEFYNQPSSGGGPAISWKDKQPGYTVQGIVAREIGKGDIQQETGAPGTPNAGQPVFFRDSRPKFVMVVPLQVQQTPEFPEGTARLFVRGNLRDELVRAMAEAGAPANAAPEVGAAIAVTLVERRQGRGTIPMNVFAVRYQRPQGAPTVPAQEQPQQYTQPQPEQTYAPVAPVQPAPQPAPAQPVQQQVAAGELTPEQQALLDRIKGQQG